MTELQEVDMWKAVEIHLATCKVCKHIMAKVLYHAQTDDKAMEHLSKFMGNEIPEMSHEDYKEDVKDWKEDD